MTVPRDPVPAPEFDPLETALEALRQGRGVVVVDGADRENEGDVVYAAEWATPENVNFLIRECRGLICAPLEAARLDALDLGQMVASNNELHQTRFTVSVDGEDTTTGISASDRSRTLLALADPAKTAAHFRRPGHVFPLRAEPGGVLRRAGHTEAAVDLCKLAGLRPAGVICEILNEDGTMARLPELQVFARKHGLPLLRIEDVIKHRLASEAIVTREAECDLPTEHGVFRLIAYKNLLDAHTHVALTLGDVAGGEDVLVRMHSECLTGDVLGSRRCDCGPQLEAALARIGSEGRGVLVYLRQEGRGIGLAEKIKAYALQERGLDTVDANLKLGHPPDLRNYGVGAGILRDLGLRGLRLLTNNPRKIVGLAGFGLRVSERLPLVVAPTAENAGYLAAKKVRLGHLF